MSEYTNRSDFTYQIFYDWSDDFLGESVDEISGLTSRNVARMKDRYFDGDWGFCFDVVQFFSDYYSIEGGDDTASHLRERGELFIAAVNEILEAEKSAYRFVSGELSDIVEEIEVSEIETAAQPQENFLGASEHLKSALRMYSDRETPDYRNSIKESISGIEAAFSVINGKKSKNMAEAVRLAIDGGLQIPPALKSGILSIYGWTSDEDGVRHALFEKEPNVGPDEAKLMLVMCSALINYLKLKQQP